jgi:hypothetical protein
MLNKYADFEKKASLKRINIVISNLILFQNLYRELWQIV